MNLKILMILILYWTVWILVLTIGATDSSNPFITDGYNITGSFNSTGFSEAEIDTGFTFWSIIAVFTSLFRFIGLVFFGITPVLTGAWQVIFAAWQTALTFFTIGFVIDAIWSG